MSNGGCIQYIERVVDGVKTLVCDWDAQNAYRWNNIICGLIILLLLAIISVYLDWRKNAKYREWGL
jgi:uncharacterized membrane protein YqjE